MKFEELKQIGDDIKSTFEEWKKADAERVDEIKKLGDATAETEAKFSALDDRLDELDVRMQKVRLDSEKEELDRDKPEVKAFEKLVRRGPNALTEDEVKHIRLTNEDGSEKKSMTVGDDTTGGFLAPTEVVNELIKGIVLFSPIREIARVRPTSFNSIKAPKRTQTTSAVWVGEVDTRTETNNLKFGKEEIGSRELSAMADISRQDLEDVQGLSLDELVLGDFSEQFGVSEGAAFVSGDGVDGKPEGILTASDQGYLGSNGIETVATAAANTLAGNDLIELYYTLKDAYARNGTWLMKRGSVKVVRKLKETSTDNYLWQPGLATLAPPTILDRPYVETVDMPGPSVSTFTTGDLPIAFGDFRRGYWIVDRLAMQTLRDPYTQAGNGIIRFWGRKRVGGQVVLPEAIKLLRVA